MRDITRIQKRIEFFKKLAQAGEGPNDPDITPVTYGVGPADGDKFVRKIESQLGEGTKFKVQPGMMSGKYHCCIFRFKKYPQKDGSGLTSDQKYQLITGAKEVLDRMAFPVNKDDYYRIFPRENGIIVVSIALYPELRKNKKKKK